jgi:ElaA protein
VAYLRLFPTHTKEHDLIFGRVVTANSVRHKGYGKKLIQTLLDYCQNNYPKTRIKCSAQAYLTSFYERFGFKTVGDRYDENNIAHITMIKDD